MKAFLNPQSKMRDQGLELFVLRMAFFGILAVVFLQRAQGGSPNSVSCETITPIAKGFELSELLNIFLDSDFRGTGLGLMLYLLMAKLADLDFEAVLHSSRAPPPSAKKTWSLLEAKGWARWDSTSEVFIFEKEIVQSRFNDVLDLFQRRKVSEEAQILPE